MKLRGYFAREGIPAWINGCVVFTNPRMRLRAEGLGNIKAVQVKELNQVFTKTAVISDIALARIREILNNVGK